MRLFRDLGSNGILKYTKLKELNLPEIFSNKLS